MEEVLLVTGNSDRLVIEPLKEPPEARSINIRPVSVRNALAEVARRRYKVTVIDADTVKEPAELAAKLTSKSGLPPTVVSTAPTWQEARDVLSATGGAAKYVDSAQGSSELWENVLDTARQDRRDSTARKPRVLFAENDPDFLATRKLILEKAGYEVVTAADPDTAREVLHQGNVDLALLDIRLENDDDENDVSGLDIATDKEFTAIPKVILTGFPSTAAAIQALSARRNGTPPAEGFLAKQEGAKAMLAAIRDYCPLRTTSTLEVIAPLVLLFGVIVAGTIAILSSQPTWFVAALILAALYAILVWRVTRGERRYT
jgi:CheY-like chemotaxis protein